MDSTILAEFRHTLYTTCFTRARDALFDLADALLTDTNARSFVELSQAASFQRAWPSLYEALEDGRIDRSALQGVWQRFVHFAATEHNVRKLGRKVGFSDALTDQQPGYRQSSRRNPTGNSADKIPLPIRSASRRAASAQIA